MYVVCQIREDGGVTVTAVAGGSYEDSKAWADKNGGEVLSAQLHEALTRGDAKTEVPVLEFKKKLALFYFRLGTKDDAVQRKWDRVLGLLDSFTEVNPGQSPIADLINAAVQDQLLLPEEAAALKAATP